MDADILYGFLGIVAIMAGAVFAHFFPRLANVLGVLVIVATLGTWLFFAVMLVKLFGFFWGLLFSAIISGPAIVPLSFANGLLNRHGSAADGGPEASPDVDDYLQHRALLSGRGEARVAQAAPARAAGGKEASIDAGGSR